MTTRTPRKNPAAAGTGSETERPEIPATSVAPKGKLGELALLLSRPEGARIDEMCSATGWQTHSVRGAISGGLKKRGLAVSSEKTAGVRVYKIVKGAGA